MQVLPLITPTQLDIKATNMKEFTWNSDTIEYFKELYFTIPTDDYYRKIEEFVKYECDLEDGETHQDLIVDLINKTQTNEEY